MLCPGIDTLLDIVERFPQGDAGSDLDAHLDRCDECRHLVSDLVRAAAVDRRTVQLRPGAHRDDADIEPPPDDPVSTESLQPGDSVGRYIIRRLVGIGGMGYVYAAHDPE